MLGIDKQEVTGSHTHIHRDTIHIREVDVTHEDERLVVVGIETEILNKKFGIDQANGVVVEAHLYTVWLTHKIGIFYEDFAIDIWMNGCAFNIEFSLAKALKSYNLIRHKTIGYR